MVYLPFPSNRFGDFYGLGNLDSVFYFALPYYCMTRLCGMGIAQRGLLSSASCLGYYALKQLTVKLAYSSKKL